MYRPNAITDAHMKKVGTDYEVRDIPDMPAPGPRPSSSRSTTCYSGPGSGWRSTVPAGMRPSFSNRFYLEITHRGCNKGDGGPAAGDAPHSPGKPLLRGDNQNDIPMMALSAIPFAPANCAQEVKDWGATIPVSLRRRRHRRHRGPAGPDLSGQTLKSEPGGRGLCPRRAVSAHSAPRWTGA